MARRGNEISKQMEFEITEKPENTSIIYFKKPSNWNKARIYIYDDSGNELKVKSQWPGEEMKYVSEDLYMYVLPNEFENAKVLFNDGDKQIPAENEEGFTIKYGEIRIYDNGNWSWKNKLWIRGALRGAFYFDYNEDMEKVNGFTVANGY